MERRGCCSRETMQRIVWCVSSAIVIWIRGGCGVKKVIQYHVPKDERVLLGNCVWWFIIMKCCGHPERGDPHFKSVWQSDYKETYALILFHQLPKLKAVSKNSLIPQHWPHCCHQRTPPGSVTETNKKLPFDGIPAYGCCDHQSIISKPLKSDGFFSPYSRYRWRWRCP